jgi:glycosyltransferase involved in cell wall biosynthesis
MDSLLWVGQFSYRKGADLLLKAFEEVSSIKPNLRLEMIGPDVGIEVEGETLGFERFAQRFFHPDLLARIHFRGLLEPSEIGRRRREAALTIVTSRVEVFPYIMLEAMAAGSPLVSTRWSGVDELVSDGESAWLADLEDPPAIARAIVHALDHGGDRQRIAYTGWRRCKDTFSNEVVGRATEIFYQRVLSNDNPS